MIIDLQHTTPAWRHKADFIIGAKITDSTYRKDYNHEQLWARTMGDGLYELCCIPFALYDIFLGDIVLVDADLELTKVVQPSGHYGFRVATKTIENQDAISDMMHEIGCLSERFSIKLMAIDAEDLIRAKQIANALQKAQDAGDILGYETIKK